MVETFEILVEVLVEMLEIDFLEKIISKDFLLHIILIFHIICEFFNY